MFYSISAKDYENLTKFKNHLQTINVKLNVKLNRCQVFTIPCDIRDSNDILFHRKDNPYVYVLETDIPLCDFQQTLDDAYKQYSVSPYREYTEFYKDYRERERKCIDTLITKSSNTIMETLDHIDDRKRKIIVNDLINFIRSTTIRQMNDDFAQKCRLFRQEHGVDVRDILLPDISVDLTEIDVAKYTVSSYIRDKECRSPWDRRTKSSGKTFGTINEARFFWELLDSYPFEVEVLLPDYNNKETLIHFKHISSSITHEAKDFVALNKLSLES